ncbi:hypothetical protein E6O75_ATG07515 [Venturia nashicola]|uniref:Uncharacterized protein n=1 Tax=Venturia nashicola TaxID=86259 RepID=A0A4Z1P6R1_9PEZI|nr:hypothetical protein E6O75_ATG07515 [Venturia nashicola]
MNRICRAVDTTSVSSSLLKSTIPTKLSYTAKEKEKKTKLSDSTTIKIYPLNRLPRLTRSLPRYQVRPGKNAIPSDRFKGHQGRTRDPQEGKRSLRFKEGINTPYSLVRWGEQNDFLFAKDADLCGARWIPRRDWI